MKYILFFFCFIQYGFISVYADEIITPPEKPTIIPRPSWGANELYTSRESTYWQDILKSWEDYVAPYISPEVKKKREEEAKKAIDYINENFSEQNNTVETVKNDPKEGFQLAWPLKYTDTVDAIIIHHTTGKYNSSLEAIQNIYKFHSLSRAWGDIGYNYIIGYDGEIYEGRKGGDYVVAAHSKWNNTSTLGISVIGDYSRQGVNKAQYESLKSLIKYLSWKYGIDTSKDYYYNTDCAGEACKTFPLETTRHSRLIGHRDSGHTSCPGEYLEAQIEEMRPEIDAYTTGFQAVKRGETPSQVRKDYQGAKSIKLQSIISLFAKYSQEEKEKISSRIDDLLLKDSFSESVKQQLQLFRVAIKLSLGS